MKKLSIYNKTYKLNDNYIYFNTFTGVFVKLSLKEHQILHDSFQDLENFEKNYPNIFNKFYQSGFIIDNWRDEKAEVYFNKRKAIYIDREYRLFLHPTLDCNFNCWYCYEEHPKEIMTKELCEKVKLHLQLMIKHISGLHLSWFGGEPLMYFNEIVYPMSFFAKELMEKKNLSFKNSITTNGYYINDKMIEKFKEIELTTFQITLDGSKEKHDKVRKHYGEPTFDIITSNIIKLCEILKNASIILRINYDENTLNYSPEFLNIFPKNIRHKIRIDFQRVWQTFKNKELSCEKPSEVINQKLLNWMDYAFGLGFDVNFTKLRLNCNYGCYVDRYYHLELDHIGRAYKCTAKGYTEDNVIGILQDDGNVKFLNEQIAKRYAKLFVENTKCFNCVYLPMCGGICSENAMLSNWVENCVLFTSEVSTDESLVKQFYFNAKRKMNLMNNL